MSGNDYIPVPRPQGGGRGRWSEDKWRREFWTRVAKGDPGACWEWQGSRHKVGHGYAWVPRSVPVLGGRVHYAHRIAFHLTHGAIPPGASICHHCDNPACCNPAHLYAGTQTDNMRDMIERDRRDHAHGSRIPHAALTDDLVREIRRRFRAGERIASIVRDMPASFTTVSAAAHGKSWTHVVD